MNVEYENAGGGCMVLVATVYDSLVNNIRYVLCNEETINLTTVDYVFSEVEYEDRMLIAYYNTEEHEAYVSASGKAESSELNELFEYCWLEFIKRDCKRWKRTICRDINDVPLELKKLIPAGYVNWLDENDQLLETDGEQIIVDDRFKRSAKEAVKTPQYIKDLEQLKEYMDHHFFTMNNSQEEMEEFYDMKATISFGNMIVNLNNSAAVFTALQEAIDYIISQE